MTYCVNQSCGNLTHTHEIFCDGCSSDLLASLLSEEYKDDLTYPCQALCGEIIEKENSHCFLCALWIHSNPQMYQVIGPALILLPTPYQGRVVAKWEDINKRAQRWACRFDFKN